MKGVIKKEEKMKVVAVERVVENRIFFIRGHKVMLSTHLAELYGVEVRSLIQAVKRNLDRFPEDFMFQLTWSEVEILRSQIVILRGIHGKHIKYLPYAFTEQGVAMLSSVLSSKRAIQVNIAIMRAFVKLRQFLSTHKELAHKLNELESKVGQHDKEIQIIFEAIKKLMTPPPPPHPESPKRKIGFRVD